MKIIDSGGCVVSIGDTIKRDMFNKDSKAVRITAVSDDEIKCYAVKKDGSIYPKRKPITLSYEEIKENWNLVTLHKKKLRLGNDSIEGLKEEMLFALHSGKATEKDVDLWLKRHKKIVKSS